MPHSRRGKKSSGLIGEDSAETESLSREVKLRDPVSISEYWTGERATLVSGGIALNRRSHLVSPFFV